MRLGHQQVSRLRVLRSGSITRLLGPNVRPNQVMVSLERRGLVERTATEWRITFEGLRWLDTFETAREAEIKEYEEATK